MQNEVDVLKKEFAIAKLEIESLRVRLKNAELMYGFAAAELAASKKLALKGVPEHVISN
jgi:hypothetical protein